MSPHLSIMRPSIENIGFPMEKHNPANMMPPAISSMIHLSQFPHLHLQSPCFATKKTNNSKKIPLGCWSNSLKELAIFQIKLCPEIEKLWYKLTIFSSFETINAINPKKIMAPEKCPASIFGLAVSGLYWMFKGLNIFHLSGVAL